MDFTGYTATTQHVLQSALKKLDSGRSVNHTVRYSSILYLRVSMSFMIQEQYQRSVCPDQIGEIWVLLASSSAANQIELGTNDSSV